MLRITRRCFTARMHFGMSLTTLGRIVEARHQYELAYASSVRQFGLHDERSSEVAYRAGYAEERFAAAGGVSADPMHGYPGAISWYERAYEAAIAGKVPLNDPVVTAVILRAGLLMDSGEVEVGLALIDKAITFIDNDVDPAVAEQLWGARDDFAGKSPRPGDDG